MQKILCFIVFVVSLVGAAVARAQLPNTEAVNEALAEAEGAFDSDDVRVVAKAYLAVVQAAQPTEETLNGVAGATAFRVKSQMEYLFGVGQEVEEMTQPYLLEFWRTVAKQYPKNRPVQERYLAFAMQSDSVPWKELQPQLLRLGGMAGLRLGLNYLEEHPWVKSPSDPLVSAAVAYVPTASPKELSDLLYAASKLALAELEATVKRRFRADSSPEVQAMAESNFVKRVWHHLESDWTWREVEELASSYDLETLTPPILSQSAAEGSGESREAWEQAMTVYMKPLPEKRPRNDEDPLLWERLGEYEALLEKYPDFGPLYAYKAEVLRAADFTGEAIVALVRAMRIQDSPEMREQLALCWGRLGNKREQALAEANRVLLGSTRKRALQLFCELGLSELLRDSGLVPASWDALLGERLATLEDRYPELLGDKLSLDAVVFWEKQKNLARAQAALERYESYAQANALTKDPRVAAWRDQWKETRPMGIFYGLPDAPTPHGVALEAGLFKGDLSLAWSAYQAWTTAEPESVAARLYGAAALVDLKASYMALDLIDQTEALAPSADEAKLLARVKAYCSASLGETVAAALAQAEAGDGEEPSFYWLTAFVDANQRAVYGRLGDRAFEIVSAESPDAQLLPWAWQTFTKTASGVVVDEWRERLRSSGILPDEAELRLPELVGIGTEYERPLRVALSDYLMAKGSLEFRDWWTFGQLAAAEGRSADAAFGAALWLMSMDPRLENERADLEGARAMVATYRDGASSEEDPEVAFLRNPCDVEAMARAYETTRGEEDYFAAAGYLRELWMAYGEDRIDLDAACNVATAAADFELLLSISQTALKREPSEANRSWYRLALIACGKDSTATGIGYMQFDESLKAISQEVSCWIDFVGKGKTYQSVLKYGEYTALHAAIAEAHELYYDRKEYGENPERELHRSNRARLEANMKNRLAAASPSLRAHLLFQLGAIDANDYFQDMAEPDDLSFSKIFAILRRWKSTGEAELEGAELVDLQTLLYDQGQHLRFRMMAQAMLQLAEVIPAPQALRASDSLILEDAPKGAISKVIAGRLVLVNRKVDLFSILGGRRQLSDGSDSSLPMVPALLRVSIAPDLPTRFLGELTAQNFDSEMLSLAKASYQPVLQRAADVLASDLAAAGTIQEERWDAISLAAGRLRAVGSNFGAKLNREDHTFMDVLLPHLNENPEDSFLAMDLIPLWQVNRLSKESKQYLKTGASAYVNDYLRGGRRTGGMEAAQRAALAYPPGSKWYPMVRDLLKKGVTSDKLAEAVKKENARRIEAAVTESRLREFEACMARKDYAEAGRLAHLLKGQAYVRWALADPRARLDHLTQARVYASATGSGYSKVTAEIQRRRNAMLETRVMSTVLTQNRTRASSGGTSWSSFTASMAAKRDAAFEHQKARDAKNFVLRFRSDGSYEKY